MRQGERWPVMVSGWLHKEQSTEENIAQNEGSENHNNVPQAHYVGS